MNNRRNVAITAAIACVLAAPLAIGPYGARADEVSDLRVNQQLLQQRVDQLAQVGLPRPVVPRGTPSIAGSFPRSFLIPGTDTSIQIGGFIDLSASYYASGGFANSNAAVPPVNGAPIASGLPLRLKTPPPGTIHAFAGSPFFPPAFNPASRQHGWFRMQASESRLYVETRTPTALGEALTHLEFDFFGCTAGGIDCSDLNDSTNPDLPRLRLAYATLGGFIAGQNWAPGNDLAAAPDIFDFGGDVGSFGFARVPQIGYKTPLAPWTPWLGDATLGVYAVQPFTELATPFGAFSDETFCVGAPQCASVTGGIGAPVAGIGGVGTNPLKTPFPDGAAVLNWEQPWGHFQLHGVLHPMEVADGAFISREYLGYGAGFSGNVKPGWLGWAKDNITFQAFAGEGLGHWNSPPGTGATTRFQALASNFGGPTAGFYGSGLPGSTTAANAANVAITTVTSWGGQVSYLHWWSPTVRSTLSFGMARQELPTKLIGPTATGANFGYNKELETAHANLIWSPVPFIDTGIEYIYDHRLTAWNQRGNGHIIDFDFKMKF